MSDTAQRLPFAQTTPLHKFYGVPVTVLDNFQPPPAIKTQGIFALPIENGPHLQFYAGIHPSKTLRIIFHGAVDPARDTYPRFDRVGTSLKSQDSFISFADPTLTVDPSLKICWYSGTERWNPNQQIIHAIEQAQEASGAERLLFIGGSGGGFAAMKYSHYFTGSCAYVFSPQTAAHRYVGSFYSELVRLAYPSLTPAGALKKYPERFNMVDLYAQGHANKIFYLQNLTDHSHILKHYLRFAVSQGMTDAMGESSNGHIRFHLYPMKVIGHGAPTAEEFDKFFQEAISFFGWD